MDRGHGSTPGGNGHGERAKVKEKEREGRMKRIQDMGLTELKRFKEILLNAPTSEGNKRQIKRVQKFIAKKEAGE